MVLLLFYSFYFYFQQHKAKLLRVLTELLLNFTSLGFVSLISHQFSMPVSRYRQLSELYQNVALFRKEI